MTRTEQMLKHLASVIEDGDDQRGHTYSLDAIDALEHAREIVRAHRSNWEHVRAIYDDKVNDQ